MVSRRLASAVDWRDTLHPISACISMNWQTFLGILYYFLFVTSEINMVSIWLVCVQCDNAVLTADDI
jgi:hypothetical protein